MKNTPHNEKRTERGIDSDVLRGLYEAEHRPGHDQKWSELNAGDASFARAALARAEEIRAEEIDPGDAYLQGVADYHAAIARQRLIDALSDFDPALLAPATSDQD